MFTETKIIYLLLKFTMFLLLFIGGKKMEQSRSDVQYWKASILPILAYTFNTGLRFGREVDYNLYYFSYNDIVHYNYNLYDFEPLYILSVKLIGRVLGLEWQCMVVFMSFFLIFSCVLFLKNFKEISCYALPWFVICVPSAENVMRWFFAFSFLLIALYVYFNSEYSNIIRYSGLFLFFSLGFMTHYGIVVIEIVLLLVLIRRKALLKPLYSVPILLIGLLLSSSISVLNVNRYIMWLSFATGRFEHYVTDDMIDLLADGSLSGTLYLSSIIMLIYGYSISKQSYRLTFVYNVATIGVITAPYLYYFEIGQRINAVLFVFQFVIMGHIFKLVFSKLSSVHKTTLIRILCVLIFANIIKGEISNTLNKDDNLLLYVWDRNGRDYLNIDMYYYK